MISYGDNSSQQYYQDRFKECKYTCHSGINSQVQLEVIWNNEIFL